MRKLLLIGAVVTGFMTLQAQTPSEGSAPHKNRKPIDPKERATKQTERMTKALGLNEDVKKKVYSINFETAQKMTELRTKYAEDKIVFERERMKLKTEKDNKIKSVLSAEQYDKWLDIKIKHKHRHHKMKHKGAPVQKMEPEQTKPQKLGE